MESVTFINIVEGSWSKVFWWQRDQDKFGETFFSPLKVTVKINQISEFNPNPRLLWMELLK